MIQEDYCSFEVAKLLKEKGFGIEEETRGYYPIKGDAGGRLMFGAEYHHNTSQVQISAPTHQMAMAWLREVYGIHVSAIPCAKRHTIVWQQNIINLNPIKEGGMFLQLEPNRINYNSYEEAVEAAIKYSLENLI